MEKDEGTRLRGRVLPGETRNPLPEKVKAARRGPVKFYVPFNVAFILFLVSHTASALYAPILDCDETYNYWEPLHYLTHGYGLQTWEYSPEYALRSWAYTGLHALPVKVISFFTASKSAQFYALRCLLGIISAETESQLYSAISRSLNPRIGAFYLLAVLTSPGIFYASTSFLPSSFAMYTSTLGLTSFLIPAGPSGPRTSTTIMYFGLGALLGWPFAGALILPFVLEDWLAAFITNTLFPTFRRYLDGIVRCLIILALQASMDTFFYRHFVIVPLQLVLYNIFSGAGRGPDIFGTEPWHFYARNLLINFNLWFLLALFSFPFLLLQTLSPSLRQQTSKQTLLHTTTLLSPFYLWLFIFTAQPHKEERFMYPAYPFLALNAAIALHMLLTWLGQSNPRTLIGKIAGQLKLALIIPIITASLLLSALRVLGTVTSYSAPLHLYSHLPSSSSSRASENICFGKDWYRFPTSFHLPTPIHARFVRSAFDGLLPGQFSEASRPGFFPGAHLIPSGMNDLNQFDPGKVIDVRHCQYLVDSSFPSLAATEQEPAYIDDSATWEVVHCERFLDASATHLIGRMIWLPEWKVIPERYRRRWGRYCLLRRRGKT